MHACALLGWSLITCPLTLPQTQRQEQPKPQARPALRSPLRRACRRRPLLPRRLPLQRPALAPAHNPSRLWPPLASGRRLLLRLVAPPPSRALGGPRRRHLGCRCVSAHSASSAQLCWHDLVSRPTGVQGFLAHVNLQSSLFSQQPGFSSNTCRLEQPARPLARRACGSLLPLPPRRQHHHRRPPLQPPPLLLPPLHHRWASAWRHRRCRRPACQSCRWSRSPCRRPLCSRSLPPQRPV